MKKRAKTRVIRVSEAAYQRLRAQAEERDMPMRVLLDLFLSRKRCTCTLPSNQEGEEK